MLANMGLKWIGKILSSIPPNIVAMYINDGRDPLIDAVKNFPDQVMFGKTVGKPFSRILVGMKPEKVLEYIKKFNPMVAGVILNHPDGMKWLREVLDKVKELMACDDVLCNSCLQPFPLYPPGKEKYVCPYCKAEYEFKKSSNRF